MAAKKELSQCSLDEFLKNNTQEIQIHSPEEVFFIREGKRASLAKGEDLVVLKDLGFMLESPFMKTGSDISKGFGGAYLLDPEGRRTGYQLINHGAETGKGGYKSWYQLEKE